MTARFAVRVSAPVYDQSTDAYRGQSVSTYAIFPTLAEAVDYAWLEGAEAYASGYSDVEFFVAYRTTGKSSGRKVWAPLDTRAYAPDSNPVDDPWWQDADIPF